MIYLRTNNQQTNKIRLNQSVLSFTQFISVFILALIIGTSVFAQDYDMYISDAGNFNNGPWQILKFDENGDNGEVFIANAFFTANNVGWPQDILFLEDQNVVLISCLNGGRITRHDADTGVYIDDFASGIGGPTRIKVGADGLIYVLQWTGSGPVLRYQQDGTFVDEFTNSGILNAIGFDWDSNGHLFVATFGGALVREFDTNGISQGIFINSNLSGPTNLYIDEDGDFNLLDWNAGVVHKFDSNGTFIENSITGLSQPEGVAFFPNGNMLTGNGGTGAIKLFDSNLTFIEDIVPPGALGLITPNAVVLRSTNPTGVTDPVVQTNFLQTSAGNLFYAQTSFTEQFESIHVISIVGQLVYTSSTISNLLWDASEISAGIYLVTATLKNGEIYVQKVIVQ